MKIFISPHNDDEVLFGSFTILREKPIVLIVTDSHIQKNRGLPVTSSIRHGETIRALNLYGVDYDFLNISDAELLKLRSPEVFSRIDNWIRNLKSSVEEIYLPAFEEDGHDHHNLLSQFVSEVPVKYTRYLTYTIKGKSVSKNEVPIMNSNWIALKHRAMAEYQSQLNLDPRMGCWPHFVDSIREYYAD